MEKNTIRVEKVMVKGCDLCNLDRIDRAVRHEDNWAGEPGVKVTVKSNEGGDDYWSDRSRRSTEICQLCMDHVLKLSTVMTTSKLASASAYEVRYSVPLEPKSEE